MPAETDRKLLLFIIQQPDVKVNVAGAAAMMSSGETTCSENAIRKRIQKLKELAKASDMNGGTEPSSSSTTTAKGKKGGKRARVQDEDEDDEEEKETPKKKKERKAPAGKKGKKNASKSEEEENELEQEGASGVKPEPIDEEEV